MLLEITALQVTGAFAGEAPAGTSKFFPGQLDGIGLWDNNQRKLGGENFRVTGDF